MKNANCCSRIFSNFNILLELIYIFQYIQQIFRPEFVLLAKSNLNACFTAVYRFNFKHEHFQLLNIKVLNKKHQVKSLKIHVN